MRGNVMDVYEHEQNVVFSYFPDDPDDVVVASLAGIEYPPPAYYGPVVLTPDEAPVADYAVEQTLGLLCPHAPFALAALRVDGLMEYRHFEHHTDAMAWVHRLPTTKAVYVVMNPYAKTSTGPGVTETDITRRRWFLIDCDPTRAKRSNSTDEEVRLARAVAAEIQSYLTSHGWPQPLGAHSGNGAHLLYAIDLPNDTATTALLTAVLKHLTRFNTPAVSVDQTTADANQLTKLYGTAVRKGPATSERPHRRSALTAIPADIVSVPLAALEQFDAADEPTTATTSQSGRYDLDAILGKLTVFSTTDKGDYTEYQIKCPWDDEHSDPGGRHGTIFTWSKTGAPGFTCPHDHCHLRKWPALRDHLGITPKDSTRGASHITKLINLVLGSGAELFCSPQGDPYITVPVGEYLDTFALTDQAMKEWLARAFFIATKSGVSSTALKDALLALSGSARATGVVRPVYVRIAAVDSCVYLDLLRSDYQVLTITADGWSVRTAPPDIRFVRRRGMLPLPIPVRDAMPIADLMATVINIKSDSPDMMLFIAWLVGALRGLKPYPIACIGGEYGATKTYACQLGRQILDPNDADLSSTPKEARDLMIAALNSHVIGFDNLSFIPDWLSDDLCRLATGAGFRTRALHTDKEEVIFKAARPIMLNGITDMIRRGDLMDRSISITLDPISEGQRRTEADVNATFLLVQPAILAALADGVSQALRAPVTLTRLPRMADFATTVESAAPAFGWKPGAFLDAYAERREQAIDIMLDNDLVALGLDKMRQINPWEGKSDELLEQLTNQTPEAKREKLPKTAKGLIGTLRRLAPGLRGKGIDVELPAKQERTGERRGQRLISIRWSLLAHMEHMEQEIPTMTSASVAGFAEHMAHMEHERPLKSR
jgi:hypothetical protein